MCKRMFYKKNHQNKANFAKDLPMYYLSITVVYSKNKKLKNIFCKFILYSNIFKHRYRYKIYLYKRGCKQLLNPHNSCLSGLN